MKFKNLLTSESVGPGHPDKICDQISDAILDECLKQDPNSRVACETFASNRLIVIGGEITTKAYVDVVKKAWEVLKPLGYDESDFTIISNINSQSPDISQAVTKDDENIGAGDQGIVFGYATNETPELMPLTIVLAHELMKELEKCRNSGKYPFLKSDMKSQVTIDYDNPKPTIDTMLISVQHDAKATKKQINEVCSMVMDKVAKKYKLNTDFKKIINPSGKFVIGGPIGDTGLTGRKIIVDTYGGIGRHGGGAFCVDGLTEYLAKDKNNNLIWKQFKDGYNGTDEVASISNNKIVFAKPLAFIENKAEKMYQFNIPNLVNMVLSENHDMLLSTKKGLIKIKTKDMLSKIEKQTFVKEVIPFKFTYDFPSTGINWTLDEIRLQVAFCADGFIIKNNSVFLNEKQNPWTGKFSFVQERKQKNIEELFAKTNTQFTKQQEANGFTTYFFNPKVLNKNLSEVFGWNVNLEQAKVICKEATKWDGNSKNIYLTPSKQEADYIQLLSMLCFSKLTSLITLNDENTPYFNNQENETFTNLYECLFTKRKYVSFASTSPFSNPSGNLEIKEEKAKKMYCFTTEYGTLLLRRNNKIFPTGNCGKDPTKVDRSGAYFARYVAKNIVAAGLADKCEIQLAFGIGIPEPVAIHIDTFNTNKIPEKEILERVKNTFDFRVGSFIKQLDLRKPQFEKTATYGHFGRNDLDVAWEKTDKAEQLKNESN